MSEIFDESHVLQLVSNIRTQFLEAYPSADSLHKIKSSTKLEGSEPLVELGKLASIIKAHSTKVGIIYNPDTLFKSKQNISTAFKELQAFTNSVFYLLSLLPLFYSSKHYAEYLLDELDACLLGLLGGIGNLCDEIERLMHVNDVQADADDSKNAKPLDTDKRPDHDDVRLISIGKIWASCDTFTKISSSGNLGLLNNKIQISSKLINDTLTEVEEWLEDPQLEDSDPFGLDNSFSGDESGQDEFNSGDEGEKQVLEQMVKFIKLWQNNLKMIKLLLSSFSKSISSNDYKSKEKDGESLTKLNQLHGATVAKIDDLISTAFMLSQDFGPEDKELKEIVEDLNDSIKKIVKIIKLLNRNEEKKGKWVEVWENKFFS